jgi:hypothetical protein
MNPSLRRTLLAALLAFLAPFATAGAGALVPFRSNGVAQLLTPPLPGASVLAVDSGSATHLGNFTSVYDLQASVDGEFLVFDGTFTSTAASGDTITFAVHVAVSLFTGAFEGEFSAIAGSGRFAGISGGLVATAGVADLNTGTFYYDCQGDVPSVATTKP